jgi:hypothetical protein
MGPDTPQPEGLHGHPSFSLRWPQAAGHPGLRGGHVATPKKPKVAAWPPRLRSGSQLPQRWPNPPLGPRPLLKRVVATPFGSHHLFLCFIYLIFCFLFKLRVLRSFFKIELWYFSIFMS